MNIDDRIAADIKDGQAVLAALDQYGLEVSKVSRLPKGHSNDHFIVEAGPGTHVLRRYAQPGQRGWNRRVRSAASVQYEHDVLAFAHARGIPCLPAVPNRDGRTVTEHDGRLYALFPFLDAQTYVDDVDAGVKAARLLAVFHRVMGEFAPPSQRPHRGFRPFLKDWFHDCEEGLGRADEILRWALTLDAQTPTQRYMAEHAAALMAALDALGQFPAELYAQRPAVVNHGDYYYANLGCRDGQIVAVYDLDDCVLDHPMLDLSLLAFMFASHGKPSMDLDVADAVIAAYRRGNDLSAGAVATLPFFVIAHMLHIAICLYGVVRSKPQADAQWLTAIHVELVLWLMQNRCDLSDHFGRL
jgi:Ser/Thr protein kinase RdoA (MazF antagonist)